MKAALLCLFLCILALAPLHAEDSVLIPAELNALLPKIRAGMTVKEVETLLATSYSGVKSKPGNWSGDAGSMDYKLNEQLLLKIASRVKGDLDKNGSNALVSKDLYLVIVNGVDKRRVTLQLSPLGAGEKATGKTKAVKTEAKAATVTQPAQP